jgi:energy-coupling factor transporter ATP-binding protein EcfA2
MFLLLTGASGAGKSTARELVAGDLAGEVECVELGHVVRIPPRPTIAWRQQATEAVVQRALALQADGRHLLLGGDPVAAGEVIAAPSADKLDAIAVCLLDVNPEAQAARLIRRGDDPRLLADHQAFASWMRAHAHDPSHMSHVLTTNGWHAMRWERLSRLDPHAGQWNVHVIDTSACTSDEVAGRVLTWCRRALGGQGSQIRVGDSDQLNRERPRNASDGYATQA